MPIYFIQAGDGGPIKIGWSDDVYQRLVKMQVDNHKPLKVLGIANIDRSGEAVFHARFAHVRLRGEWFAPVPAVLGEATKHAIPQKQAVPMNMPMNPVAQIRKQIFRMSQAEFAAAVSVNQSTISRWESGELAPSIEELGAIRRLAAERGIAWSDRWFFEPPDDPKESSEPDKVAS